MASVVSEKPVNGNYGMYNGAAEPYQPLNADRSNFTQSNNSSSTTNGTKFSSAEEEKPGKEMIGWYFVEQYYNTMSKEPGKLYLYYTRKSQFVAGNEAEKVSVAVGNKRIGERIKELDIEDCKVRVTNVDSQASGDGILVQVIGEMSNKAAPHRKFTQTFVLAEQATGYFVLNDILRYIIEEDEEDAAVEEEETINSHSDTPAAAANAEPATAQQIDQEDDSHKIEPALTEQKSADGNDQSAYGNPTSIDSSSGSHSSIPKDIADDNAALPSHAIDPSVSAQQDEVDVPTPKQDSMPAVTAVTTSSPSKPAAPRTWASLVSTKASAAASASNGVKSVNGVPPPTKSKGAQAPAKEETVTVSPSNENPESIPAQATTSNAWQTAGDSKQGKGRQHSASISGDSEKVLAYIKNVTEKVDGQLLRSTLEKYGKLAYFDISRSKNCAFVEFADVSAYHAAVADNPHQLGGENVLVEERRPRGNTFVGGNGTAVRGMRGGANNRFGASERANAGGRSNFNKEGGRGSYGSRGRGGNGASARGRNHQVQPAS